MCSTCLHRCTKVKLLHTDLWHVLLQGNALLVGVGGSGKQSLAKLAAFMAGCEVFEITLTRGYDEVMFREDLKQLYTMIGADNKKVQTHTDCNWCVTRSFCHAQTIAHA